MATNNTGFSALPGGFRENKGRYIAMGSEAHFWFYDIDSYPDKSGDTIYHITWLFYWLTRHSGTIRTHAVLLGISKIRMNWGLSLRCILGLMGDIRTGRKLLKTTSL